MCPIYDYNCSECGNEFEVFYTSQSKVEIEEPEEKCPKCGCTQKTRQFPKNTSFILEGLGWARDNYGG
jgi:putative FmdB family regulatory protein